MASLNILDINGVFHDDTIRTINEGQLPRKALGQKTESSLTSNLVKEHNEAIEDDGQLPPEVFGHILSYLDPEDARTMILAFMYASRAFYHIGVPHVWSKVSFGRLKNEEPATERDHTREESDHWRQVARWRLKTGQMAGALRFIRHLSLASPEDWTSELTLIMDTAIPYLAKLSIGRFWTDKFMDGLWPRLELAENLQHLDIQGPYSGMDCDLSWPSGFELPGTLRTLKLEMRLNEGMLSAIDRPRLSMNGKALPTPALGISRNFRGPRVNCEICGLDRKTLRT